MPLLLSFVLFMCSNTSTHVFVSFISDALHIHIYCHLMMPHACLRSHSTWCIWANVSTMRDGFMCMCAFSLYMHMLATALAMPKSTATVIRSMGSLGLDDIKTTPVHIHTYTWNTYTFKMGTRVRHGTLERCLYSPDAIRSLNVWFVKISNAYRLLPMMSGASVCNPGRRSWSLLYHGVSHNLKFVFFWNHATYFTWNVPNSI